MKMLQKGDKCPMCGKPIKTDDPNRLIAISAFGWIREQADAGKWNPENSICEDGSTGATNADKLRSLPEDEISKKIRLGYRDLPCREAGWECQNYENCNDCRLSWLKAPYTGWDNEKKS